MKYAIRYSILDKGFCGKKEGVIVEHWEFNLEYNDVENQIEFLVGEDEEVISFEVIAMYKLKEFLNLNK